MIKEAFLIVSIIFNLIYFIYISIIIQLLFTTFVYIHNFITLLQKKKGSMLSLYIYIGSETITYLFRNIHRLRLNLSVIIIVIKYNDNLDICCEKMHFMIFLKRNHMNTWVFMNFSCHFNYDKAQ